MSLSKYFRFGSERGTEGNSQLKRMSRKKRVKAFSVPRLQKQGYKTNLLHDLLVERVDDNVAQFRVSFSKKPLVGKIFTGVLMTHYKEVMHQAGKPIVNKMESLYANLQHIHRELQPLDAQLSAFYEKEDGWYKKGLTENDEGEQEIEATEEHKLLVEKQSAYILQRNKILKEVSKFKTVADKLAKQRKHYPMVKTKLLKLRITNIVEYDDDLNSWICLSEPAYTQPTKTVRKWIGKEADSCPQGVRKWLHDRGLLSILTTEANSIDESTEHLGL